MCIAICVKKGVKIPSKEILEECFLNNPDGGGFAFWLEKGKVQIQKGYMTFDEFYNALKRADEEFNLTDRGVLIHTRITTHGGTNPKNCHPFPMSTNLDDLRSLDIVSESAVIHNGIMNSPYLPGKDEDYSDTMKFIKDFLVDYYNKDKSFMHRPEEREKIQKIIGSKLAILDGNGDIEVFGEFIEDEGVLYSNTSYKCPKYYSWSNSKANSYYGGMSYYNNWSSYYDDYYDEWEEYESFYYDNKNDLNKKEQKVFANDASKKDDFWCKKQFFKDVDDFTYNISGLTVLDNNKCVLLDDMNTVFTSERFDIAIDKYYLLYKIGWDDMSLQVCRNNFIVDIYDVQFNDNKNNKGNKDKVEV